MRRKARAGDGVLTLKATLPQADVDNARKTQSIKIDDDYFLPLFRNGCVPLPFIFVRSSLFPGSLNPEPAASQKLTLLKSWSKNEAITITGPHSQLCSFDRSVFAACLLQFKNRPLSSDDDDNPVSTTLRKLSENLGINHGSGVADRIKASLERLSSTGITIENKATQLELKSLISIETSAISPKKINIRVPERLAVLYKEKQWWSVPLPAITRPGLAGWLGCYYSTHIQWDQVKLEKIRELCGLSINGYAFKAKLTKALTSLQDESMPEGARIKSYDFEKSAEDNSEVLIAKTDTMTGPAIRRKLAQ